MRKEGSVRRRQKARMPFGRTLPLQPRHRLTHGHLRQRVSTSVVGKSFMARRFASLLSVQIFNSVVVTVMLQTKSSTDIRVTNALAEQVRSHIEHHLF